MIKLFSLCFLFFQIQSFAYADSDKKPDIYIMGVEQLDSTGMAELVKKYPAATMIYETADLKSGRPGKSQKSVVRKTSAAQSTESLKTTLQSFQDAIKDLCISQVELSLAFSASANAWIVVNGEVSASAKVIIKNSNEKCK